MLFGVWSVCLHINTWGPGDILRFEQDVERYGRKIISFDDVVTYYGSRRLDWKDKLFEVVYPHFLRMRLMLRGSWKHTLTSSMP